MLNKRSKNTNHVVATHQIKFFLQSYQRGSVNLGLCYEMCSFYYKKVDHVTMTPYTISYWWSFGTKPLSLTVSEISNGECNAMVDL